MSLTDYGPKPGGPTHPPQPPTPPPPPPRDFHPLRDLFRVVGAVAVAIAESLQGRTA